MCSGEAGEQKPPRLTALNKWPSTKIIDSHFKTLAKERIRYAMDHIMGYTCLEFKEHHHRGRQPAIVIELGKDGSSSVVGYRPNEDSVVSLEHPGCTSKSTVVHELMHALGFYHEHERFDRDQHVTVNFSNIEPQLHDQFKIEYFDTLGRTKWAWQRSSPG